MPIKKDITSFKVELIAAMEPATHWTPQDSAPVIATACEDTGNSWQFLRKQVV
uniref:hypothetical protein n=1 Tax=Variovorax sp. BK018 TaxID=3450241 RepID=UPI0040396820